MGIKEIAERVTKKCMKVATYLLENDDILIDVVSLIYRTDGSLDDLFYEVNDQEFFEGFVDKYEIARAISFGDYRFMDKWVAFDGCGNLTTLSDSQYRSRLKNNIVEIIDTLFEKKDKIMDDLKDYDKELVRLLNEKC